MTTVHELWMEAPAGVGALRLVAEDGALAAVHLAGAGDAPEGWDRAPAGDPVLARARAQLAEYFAGTRTAFSLPVAPAGTPFQQSVWRELMSIPYGQTRSYGQLANTLGGPHLTRAVGSANGRNPISIVVPCHRVVGSDGSLTGYAGGLPRKRFLLDLEARPR